MNKFVLPLIGTALLLIGVALFISCDDVPTANRNERFVEIGVYEARGESCFIRVIEDKQTGCDYLITCNSPTVMPHTCFLDRAAQ